MWVFNWDYKCDRGGMRRELRWCCCPGIGLALRHKYGLGSWDCGGLPAENKWLLLHTIKAQMQNWIYVETYRLSDQNFIGGKTWSKIYYNKITSVKYKIKKFSGWTLVKTGLTPCFPIRGQTGIHSFLFQKQDHLRMNKSTGSNNHLRKGFP